MEVNGSKVTKLEKALPVNYCQWKGSLPANNTYAGLGFNLCMGTTGWVAWIAYREAGVVAGLMLVLTIGFMLFWKAFDTFDEKMQSAEELGSS